MKRQLKRVLFACILAILAVGLKYSSGKAHPRIKSLVKRCAAVVAPRSVFAQGVTVLWSADMEPVAGGSGSSTLGEWYEPNCCEGDDVNPPVPTADNNGGGVYNSGIASAGPSFDFAHSGTYSAMLKVDTSNNPPNTTSGTRLFRRLESKMNNSNSDLYYSVWFYFPIAYTPNGTPNNWWNIFQWKSKSVSQGKNDPMFNLEVTNWGGQMYLYLCPLRSSMEETVKRSRGRLTPTFPWGNGPMWRPATCARGYRMADTSRSGRTELSFGT